MKVMFNLELNPDSEIGAVFKLGSKQAKRLGGNIMVIEEVESEEKAEDKARELSDKYGEISISILVIPDELTKDEDIIKYASYCFDKNQVIKEL